MSSNKRKGNYKQKSDMKDDPKIWRQFGVTKRRLARFLTVLAANAANAINNLGAEPCHGMEEVVGSIPTRSTKPTTPTNFGA
jgi:hypothetical protein